MRRRADHVATCGAMPLAWALIAVCVVGCAAPPPRASGRVAVTPVRLRGESFFVETSSIDTPVAAAVEGTQPQDADGEATDEIPGADGGEGSFNEPGFDGDVTPGRNPDELPAPLLQPADGSAPVYGPVPEDEEPGLDVHGSVSLRYVRRTTGGQHSDDLYSFVTLDVGNADRDAQTFHMDGRVFRSLSTDKQEFGGLEDTYSGNTRTRLYNAYVDFHGVGVDLMRVGRQTDYDTPEVVYYDGVHVRSEALDDDDSQVGVYGGISNHLYESSTEGDRVYGVYVESRPWDGGRMRFDWMHADDDETLGNQHDDLVAVQAWQAFERLRLEGSFSRYEDSNRDYRLASTWFDAEDDLMLRASYYSLLEKQTTSALEFDDLTTPLNDLYPYRQVDVSAAHGVAKDVSMQGGASIRVVDDASDKTEFNRDVNRYYLTTAFSNVASEKNTVSVTGEYWQGDKNQNTAAGLDLTRDVTDDLEASIGTYYSLYKTDLFGESEREDVQTYYMRFDYDISKAYTVDLGYEFEDSSVGNFHNIRMAARWRF